MSKTATTQYPVIDLIKNRWSPRAFSEQALTEEEVNTILEAASWSASAMNEQPWEYYVAHKNTEGFNKIFNCLVEFNQLWAKNAAVLIVAVARKTFAANQDSNIWAEHDLGLANATLMLQASSMGIYSHAMAGFVKEKAIESLELASNQNPICVIALGRLGDAESLVEPYKSREAAPRTRKSISEFTKFV